MRIAEITNYLESFAPISSQESYDNSGLIVGDSKTEVTNALISLDCTEEIVEEAIQRGCNLIIAHHPIVFKGLKKFNGSNYVERTVIKAIKHDIAIYAIHTNLDNYQMGVNKKIGDLIGVSNPQILSPSSQKLVKLAVIVPLTHVEAVKNTLFSCGAGQIGNYNECSFSTEGEGTFKASPNANPHVGEIGERHHEKETKVEVIVSSHLLGNTIAAMINAHPYEEVAYDCIPLLNKNSEEGAGMIGKLAEPIAEEAFLSMLKKVFNCGVIRHTSLLNKPIQKVAWCGGAGSFLLGAARGKGADIYITGDFKYHEFFDAENQIIIADIGHFESEQYTIELLDELLRKKFATFAPCLTEINTNPVKYF